MLIRTDRGQTPSSRLSTKSNLDTAAAKATTTRHAPPSFAAPNLARGKASASSRVTAMAVAQPPSSWLSLQLKHGRATVLMEVPPQTTFRQLSAMLLAILRQRYPHGLRTAAGRAVDLPWASTLVAKGKGRAAKTRLGAGDVEALEKMTQETRQEVHEDGGNEAVREQGQGDGDEYDDDAFVVDFAVPRSSVASIDAGWRDLRIVDDLYGEGVDFDEAELVAADTSGEILSAVIADAVDMDVDMENTDKAMTGPQANEGSPSAQPAAPSPTHNLRSKRKRTAMLAEDNHAPEKENTKARKKGRAATSPPPLRASSCTSALSSPPPACSPPLQRPPQATATKPLSIDSTLTKAGVRHKSVLAFLVRRRADVEMLGAGSQRLPAHFVVEWPAAALHELDGEDEASRVAAEAENVLVGG